MHSDNKYIVGIFDDDEQTIDAVKHVRGAGIKIHEVYSPFPIHGIDPALGYKRSRLPQAAFMFGCLGLACALTLMFGTMAVDWPMNIGGKPYYGPQFIPIAFEATVLFTALGMVGTFFLASGLGPGANKVVFDPRSTDDKFVMAIELSRNTNHTSDAIMDAVRQAGASEVYVKEVVNQ